MTGAQWLLLCLVEACDAPRLLAELAATGCGTTDRLGQGGFLTQGRVGVFVVAAPGEVPLVLATIRQTCARRIAAGHAPPGLAVMVNPLSEESGGAAVFALPVRNTARWALGDQPGTRNGTGGWGMIDAAILGGETIALSDARPTKLVVAIVPDRAAERALHALADRQLRATIVGSTGGFFRSGNTTIVADVPSEQAQLAAETIRAACISCHDVASPEHGIAFALDVAWQVSL
jgi:uncharacterized protein YaaQ